MTRPPLYLDECVRYNLVGALRKRGFVVTHALDEGMANQGLDDEQQLDFATQRGWALVTYNADEFRRRHSQYLQRDCCHAGIIAVTERGRLEVRALRLAILVDWIAATVGDPRNEFFFWGQLQRLFEGGYVPPGYSAEDVLIVLGR